MGREGEIGWGGGWAVEGGERGGRGREWEGEREREREREREWGLNGFGVGGESCFSDQ